MYISYGSWWADLVWSKYHHARISLLAAGGGRGKAGKAEIGREDRGGKGREIKEEEQRVNGRWKGVKERASLATSRDKSKRSERRKKKNQE